MPFDKITFVEKFKQLREISNKASIRSIIFYYYEFCLQNTAYAVNHRHSLIYFALFFKGSHGV